VSTLSVIVITKNEERNIRACLQSVAWADEIIIVDAGSQDRTMEIAKEFLKKCLVDLGTGMEPQRIMDYLTAQVNGSYHSTLMNVLRRNYGKKYSNEFPRLVHK